MLNETYLTRDEVATLLHVKRSTLDVWASTKRYHLPFIKVGRKCLYRKSDIVNFIEELANS